MQDFKHRKRSPRVCGQQKSGQARDTDLLSGSVGTAAQTATGRSIERQVQKLLAESVQSYPSAEVKPCAVGQKSAVVKIYQNEGNCALSSGSHDCQS